MEALPRDQQQAAVRECEFAALGDQSAVYFGNVQNFVEGMKFAPALQGRSLGIVQMQMIVIIALAYRHRSFLHAASPVFMIAHFAAIAIFSPKLQL